MPSAVRPLAALAALVLVAHPLAAEPAPSKAKVHGIALSGRVTKVNAAAKTLVVADSSGREISLSWTDATKITGGELKTGELVTLRYFDREKKHIATTIQVGAAAAASSAAQPKTPAPAASPSTR